MIKTTIRDALRGVVGASLHRLYKVSDGDTVLYIGQSIEPLNRLKEHMGLHGRGGTSTLGTFIHDFLPGSLSFTYELFTVEECKPLIVQYETMPLEDYKEYGSASIDAAETALIKHYHPCLNNRYGAYAAPLPEKYRRVQVNEPIVLEWLSD